MCDDIICLIIRFCQVSRQDQQQDQSEGNDTGTRVSCFVMWIDTSLRSLEWKSDGRPNAWCAFTQRSVPFYA